MKKQGRAIIWGMLLAMFLTHGCATLPRDYQKSETHALSGTADTLLGRLNAREIAAHPEKSGFYILGNGLDAFVARAALAHVAERSIDVQYYLYHGDLVGRLFTDQLIKAADRGVRVRLLVDDMGLEGRDLALTVLDSHPNVQVRIFNPFSRNVGRISQFITRMGGVTRRMHNKSFTVDNQATILGGRNIGNEYFEADPELAFADLDVMGIGPVVRDVSTVFDRYWNSELAYPASVLKGRKPTPEEISGKQRQLDQFVAAQADSPYLDALRNSDLAERLRKGDVNLTWGDAEVVYDQPEKLLRDFSETQYHLSWMIKPYWEGIERELIIFSPYFVPGAEGTAFLTKLAGRGVRVRILTNSLASNDVGIVHAGYAKYRKTLLKGGVELYEMNKRLSRAQRREKKGTEGSSKSSLHAKSFVFDRRQAFIGSLNLDPRAIIHNTEIGVVITSTEIAEGMSDWFDQNVEELAFRLELGKDAGGGDRIVWHGIVDGEEKTFAVDPYTGFWRRMGIGILSLLPIESQL